MEPTQGEIRLEELTKVFDDAVAVDAIDVHIQAGEFFTLLGPSGCGKTTTLRMIAGFERPTSGRILLDGVDVASVPPHKRQVNTVFQSYALFPHLNVTDNVAFGLKYLKLSKDERRARTKEALDLVQLGDFATRRTSQLSGGQQQRVALARALVLYPRVLLLDEPLGALDARLRKELQVQLKTLQKELGITFVFVTHDQEEALTMSDRLAVMNGGHVEQAGAPKEVYEEPETVFVADFLGVSNLLDAQAMGRDGSCCNLRIGGMRFRAGQGATDSQGDVRAMIRPERITVEPHGNGESENRLPGMVEQAVFLGGSYEVHVRVLGGQLLKATVANDGRTGSVDLEAGTPVSVYLPSDCLRVLSAGPPPDEHDEPEPSEPATVSG
jgi:spermidine/putrescine transport system ATP-binding protein